MIGNITQPNGLPLNNKNTNIYLLDIRNFTWVDTFELSTPSNSSSSDPPTYAQPSTPTSASNALTLKIVTATLSAVVCTIFIMAIVFFGYRWHKNRKILGQNEVMRIYGNHGNA